MEKVLFAGQSPRKQGYHACCKSLPLLLELPLPHCRWLSGCIYDRSQYATSSTWATNFVILKESSRKVGGMTWDLCSPHCICLALWLLSMSIYSLAIVILTIYATSSAVQEPLRLLSLQTQGMVYCPQLSSVSWLLVPPLCRPLSFPVPTQLLCSRDWQQQVLFMCLASGYCWEIGFSLTWSIFLLLKPLNELKVIFPALWTGRSRFLSILRAVAVTIYQIVVLHNYEFRMWWFKYAEVIVARHEICLHSVSWQTACRSTALSKCFHFPFPSEISEAFGNG